MLLQRLPFNFDEFVIKLKFVGQIRDGSNVNKQFPVCILQCKQRHKNACPHNANSNVCKQL